MSRTALKRQVTAQDVALRAGVPRSTVSVVLNGARSNIGVASSTRTRIEEAARELNYRPSAAAQALASGRTMQIAALSGAPQHAGMDDRTDLRGLVDAAAAHNYRVVVLPLHEGEAGSRQLEHLILDRVCDGVCLFSHQVGAPHLRALEKHPIPCVVIGDPGECDWGDNHLRTARVDIDNYRYAWDSVAWLVAQGHRRIAYARSAGEVEHEMDAALPSPHQHHTYHLQRGFRDAMRELCDEPNPHLLRYHGHGEAVEFARSGVATAVVVRYLHSALHWMMRLGTAGFKLPDDFTVLAQLESEEVMPIYLAGCLEYLAIHTRSHRELGATAGELLISWIRGDVPPRTTLVATNEPRWGRDIMRR